MGYIIKLVSSPAEVELSENINGKLDVKEEDDNDLELILTEE